jgi:hypothetical protein
MPGSRFGRLDAAERHSCLSNFSAFLTSDWDKPNCRAIRAGVMPA